MPLISCPECTKQISDRAEACPHCGLPARFFSDANEASDKKPASVIDMSALRNALNCL